MPEQMTERQYRVASTLGPRYATPTHFPDLEAAQGFLREHHRILGDLPGSDTLRIETREVTTTTWEAV